MSRSKYLNKQYYSIMVISIIVIVAIIIAVSGSKKSDVLEDELSKQSLSGSSNQENAQPEVVEEEPEEVVQPKATKKSSKEIGEEGLCEDYVLVQGDELKIVGHEITLNKIGPSAVRINVDGEEAFLNEGDEEYLGDGIRVGLDEDAIIYFDEDDTDNAVELRVGCKIDENPNEKYVQDRGRNLCEDLYNNFIKQYEQCKETFDVE